MGGNTLKRKSILLLTALMLVMSMFLAACGSKEKSSESTDGKKSASSGPKDGGTLVYGVDTAPEGIFNFNFYGNASDSNVLQFIDDDLLTYDSGKVILAKAKDFIDKLEQNSGITKLSNSSRK